MTLGLKESEGIVQVEEVRLSEFTEWCWYFPQTREQYRLGGSFRIISSENEENEQQVGDA